MEIQCLVSEVLKPSSETANSGGCSLNWQCAAAAAMCTLRSLSINGLPINKWDSDSSSGSRLACFAFNRFLVSFGRLHYSWTQLTLSDCFQMAPHFGHFDFLCFLPSLSLSLFPFPWATLKRSESRCLHTFSFISLLCSFTNLIAGAMCVCVAINGSGKLAATATHRPHWAEVLSHLNW